MANPLGICVAVFWGVSSTVVLAQANAHVHDVPISKVAIESDSSIESIPPLAQAVLSGDAKLVSQAIENAPKSVNDPVRARPGAHAGFTPLILAAALSEPDIAEMLIQNGANITVLDDYHRSAFWYAALREDVRITKILLKAQSVGEVVNTPDYVFKRTPLHVAVRGDEPEVVDLLLQAGASGTQKDILDETPREYCNFNFTDACKALR